MGFKLIPAGTFIMGDTKVKKWTPHEVILTTSFKMGVHEVTQAQYEQVMGVNPSRFRGANNPVETVTWDDAVKFCRRLSDLPAERAAGNVYRLPTEAERELACRAGTTTKFIFANVDSEFEQFGWCYENSGNKTHQVGSKQANAWGLYDMHGKVWEWCQDWYGAYPSGSVTDPSGATSGSDRVVHGGSWRGAARSCGSGRRGYIPAFRVINRFRFRVSLSPSGQSSEP